MVLILMRLRRWVGSSVMQKAVRDGNDFELYLLFDLERMNWSAGVM